MKMLVSLFANYLLWSSSVTRVCSRRNSFECEVRSVADRSSSDSGRYREERGSGGGNEAANDAVGDDGDRERSVSSQRFDKFASRGDATGIGARQRSKLAFRITANYVNLRRKCTSEYRAAPHVKSSSCEVTTKFLAFARVRQDIPRDFGTRIDSRREATTSDSGVDSVECRFMPQKRLWPRNLSRSRFPLF